MGGGAGEARKHLSTVPKQAAKTPPDLHLIVPVYNEAENFPRFYESVKAHIKTPHDLIVVYDFDEDTTVPVARALADKDPSLLLVKNTGKGVLGALKTGLAYPKGGALIVTMADCSDDHRCVDAMYQLYQQGCHVVSASRYAPGGAQHGGPKLKGMMSRVAGMSLNLLGGIPTRDPTNNFKLYSKLLLEQVEIQSEGGFEVALELTVKAHAAGLKIAELPTVWTDRVAGQSNFKLLKWLPRYLKWYVHALRHRALSLVGR
jgi:dolichol-phosphate mannosyltransferase